MNIKNRVFKIEDIDCEITVEFTSKKKDIFDIVDEYIENLPYEWFDPADDSFAILYKDGTYDFIDQCYDGHKIRKQNVLSIVNNNPGTYFVYGPFEINEYGVVTPAAETIIADHNIKEV